MWFFLMLILVVFLVVFILFFYRSKDLVINQKGIYTGRAGQFHWKEIEKAEIKDMVNLFFKKEKSLQRHINNYYSRSWRRISGAWWLGTQKNTI